MLYPDWPSMRQNKYLLVVSLVVAVASIGDCQTTHYSLLCNVTAAAGSDTYRGPVKFQVSVPGFSVSHLAAQELKGPRAVVILQDISGSMRSPNALKVSMGAVRDFLELSAPEDRLALVNFNEELYIDIQLKDLAAFRREFDDPALSKQLEPRGRTRLFDAIAAAADYLKRHSGQETDSLFVISDGEDNDSGISAAPLRKKVLSFKLRLYLLALANPAPKSELRSRRDFLDMVRDSGGAILGTNPSNMVAVQGSRISPEKPIYDASPEAMARIRQQVETLHNLLAKPLRLEFDLNQPVKSSVPVTVNVLTAQGQTAAGITPLCPRYLNPN